MLETEQYSPTSPPSRDAEWDDFQDLLDDLHMVGDVEADTRHQSVDEPDGEHEPPPRDEAVVSEGTTPLQQALRHSPDQLDGMPRRKRSRSPRGRGLYAKQTAKQSQQAEHFNGFLAQRAPKKNQKKGNKELVYSRESPEVQAGIYKAREKEWSNWTNFDACDVLEPEVADQFMAQNPYVQVVPLRWVDIDKSEVNEDPFYKSRIVVRGDLEVAVKDGDVRTQHHT